MLKYFEIITNNKGGGVVSAIPTFVFQWCKHGHCIKTLFKRIKQPILSDNCQLQKLYYKSYSNRLSQYFEMVLSEYEADRHNLGIDLIQIAAIRM